MTKLDVVSYVPAIHQGYLEFFEKYPGDIYILGDDFINEAPKLERDIRAVSPELIRAAIGSLVAGREVSILTYSNLDDLKSHTESVVMPDDEVNRQFAESHLGGTPYEHIPAFLRWNWQESTKNHAITPDTIVTEAEFDNKMMSLAYEESEKSPDWWRQVGAVVVKNDEVLYAGYNAPYPDPDYDLNTFGDPRANFDAGEQIEASKVLHTELGIIAKAARDGVSLEGTHIYITTFPCPVCARAVAASGIEKVYFSQGYSRLDAVDVFKRRNIKIVQVVPEQS